MPLSAPPDDEGQLYTRVDDELYEELTQLQGQPIVHTAVWEEGLADSLAPTAPSGDTGTPRAGSADDEVAADIDLYLRDGVYFELYGTLCYTDIDAAPLHDLRQIEAHLQDLVKTGAVLEEVAVDEDDGLVLVLAHRHQPLLYLQVGAWLLEEWEELPDASAT